MRIKLDENLPQGLAARLTDLGHDVHTSQQENLVGCTDEQLWAATQKETRFLITQDMDFSDARRFAPDSHHGILLVRLYSPSRISLMERLEALFVSEPVDTWKRCFVVVSESKVRVRRPAS